MFPVFRSAPGGEAGGKSMCSRALKREQCFNPPPAVRPGESGQPTEEEETGAKFQSAPGGEAGERPVARRSATRWSVSIRPRR